MIKKIITIIYTIFISLFKNIQGSKNKYLLLKIYSDKSSMNFNNSFFERSTINLEGDNEINIKNALVSNSSITIKGEKNKLIVEDGVKLRNVTINIRGQNCTIRIGQNTTFGGVRIVNVGIDNNVTIGKNCLFADNIEVWASDTHSIFDNEGGLINDEKPVIIENNVWIGSYVKILKGVTLSEGSVIGMGTLITKSTPPFSMIAGNPARVLKKNITWSLDYKGI